MAYESLCNSIINCHMQWELFAQSTDPYQLMSTKFDVSLLKDGK